MVCTENDPTRPGLADYLYTDTKKQCEVMREHILIAHEQCIEFTQMQRRAYIKLIRTIKRFGSMDQFRDQYKAIIDSLGKKDKEVIDFLVYKAYEVFDLTEPKYDICDTKISEYKDLSTKELMYLLLKMDWYQFAKSMYFECYFSGRYDTREKYDNDEAFRRSKITRLLIKYCSCEVCGVYGHKWTNDCLKKHECTRCYETGHMERRCPVPVDKIIAGRDAMIVSLQHKVAKLALIIARRGDDDDKREKSRAGSTTSEEYCLVEQEA